MRLLFISDIHANLEALNAILAAVNYDRIVCLGDLVDYGPDPLECIDWIRSNNVPVVRGNHDNAVALHVDCGCGYMYKHLSEATREYTWQKITGREEAYLRELPAYIDIEADGLKIKAVHGSPGSFFDYMYPDMTDGQVESFVSGLTCDHLFAGHTHVPMVRKMAKTTILNPGSVGQPRDNDWRASCMVFNTQSREPEIIRLKYDIDKTCRKIRESMPHADELEAILRRGF